MKSNGRIIYLCLLFGVVFWTGNAMDAQGAKKGVGINTTVQDSHTKEILAIAIDPKGRFIASGGFDDTIKIWDLNTGKLLRTIEGHLQYINALAIDPNGKFIVSGGKYDNAKIWDINTGKLLRTFEGKTPSIHDVALDPEGKLLVTAGSKVRIGYPVTKTIKIWNIKSGELLKSLEGHSLYTNSVTIDPTGKYIISAGGFNDHTIKVWDLRTGRLLKTIKGHSAEIQVIKIDPKGQFVVSGSNDNTIKIWDLNSGKLEKTLRGHTYPIRALEIDPRGEFIVSGSSDKTIKIWNLKTGKLLRTIEKNNTISSLAIDPSGKVIITGSSSGKYLTTWDLKTGQLIKDTVPGIIFSIYAHAIDPQGRFIVTGGADNKIYIWDLKTGNFLRKLESHSDAIDSLAIDPNGRFIASGSAKTVKVWDLRTGKLLRTIEGYDASKKKWLKDNMLMGFNPETEWSTFKCIVFDPEGQLIIVGNTYYFCYDANCRTGSISYIEVWNLDGNKLYQTPFERSYLIESIVVDPKGNFIISGLANGNIDIRTLKTGKVIKTFKAHSHLHGLAVGPNGNFFISAGSKGIPPNYAFEESEIKVWNLKTHKLIKTLKGYAHNMDSIAIGNKGKYIFTGGSDKILRVWNLRTGELINTFKGHSGSIRTVSFDSKKQIVISSGNDGTLKLWSHHNQCLLATLYLFQDASISMTPEGYFFGKGDFSNYIHYVKDLDIIDFNQLYDVFYRPDIVQMKLQGKDISSLINLTVEEALQNPPPKVEFRNPTKITNTKSIPIKYIISSTGGGIGEVRVFHNGKLIHSDGYYKDLSKLKQKENIKLVSINSDTITRQLRSISLKSKKPSLILSKPKGEVYEGEVIIDSISGENEISLAAFNRDNTVQSQLKTIKITANIPKEDPHLYVLAIGIDKYKDSSINLQYATKDAKDFISKFNSKASTIFKQKNIHVYTLTDEEATKRNIISVMDRLDRQIKPADRFVLFLASHGVLNYGVYSIVTSDYAMHLNDQVLISSSEIMDYSKKIRALDQIFIFDTCHAGGVDNLFSGLYDSRMTVFAKTMGLHMFASASSKQQAIDGYKNNGLFTHTLLNGLENKGDTNRDQKVTIKELGQYSKNQTSKISSEIGYQQVPLIINFGKDNVVYKINIQKGNPR